MMPNTVSLNLIKCSGFFPFLGRRLRLIANLCRVISCTCGLQMMCHTNKHLCVFFSSSSSLHHFNLNLGSKIHVLANIRILRLHDTLNMRFTECCNNHSWVIHVCHWHWLKRYTEPSYTGYNKTRGDHILSLHQIHISKNGDETSTRSFRIFLSCC